MIIGAGSRAAPRWVPEPGHGEQPPSQPESPARGPAPSRGVAPPQGPTPSRRVAGSPANAVARKRKLRESSREGRFGKPGWQNGPGRLGTHPGKVGEPPETREARDSSRSVWNRRPGRLSSREGRSGTGDPGGSGLIPVDLEPETREARDSRPGTLMTGRTRVVGDGRNRTKTK